MTAMWESFVNKATDLRKSLPLDASLLMHLKCLDPANRKKTKSVARIGKLEQLLPHVWGNWMRSYISTRPIQTAAGWASLVGLRKKMESWNALTCTGPKSLIFKMLHEKGSTHFCWKLWGAVCHCKTEIQVWREVFQNIRTLLDLKEIISQTKAWWD